jgi:voltage-gated potassium channel Kch
MGQEEAPVLVCGLGLFGQAVLARLRPFGVPLRLLDRCVPDWGSPGLEAALGPCLTLGDMRKPHVLRQAQAERARAVLLLSSDSGVNIEAALQVRALLQRDLQHQGISAQLEPVADAPPPG